MNKSNSGPASGENVVKTACQMCSWSCGINVYVRHGRMVKVEGMSEHPLNRGKICIKARVNICCKTEIGSCTSDLKGVIDIQPSF